MRKPGKNLIIYHYWVANFKLDEINIALRLEKLKKP